MNMLPFYRNSPRQHPRRLVSLHAIKSGRPEFGSPRWMLARLQRTVLLGLCLAAVNLFASLQAVPPRPASALPVAQSSSTIVQHDRPRAVLPVGWRRTAQGWQYISSWNQTPDDHRTLHQHILAQQQNEAVWLQRLMAVVRSIPPTHFALFQLISVGIVAILAWRNRDLVELATRRKS